MKNTLIMTAVAAAVAIATTVQATPISGTVNFAGSVTLNSGSSVAGATSVTGWSGPAAGKPYVAASSGDLSAAFLTPVTFTAPWTFGTGQTALWSFLGANGDTYTFNLLASTLPVFSGSPTTMSVTGSGTIIATGPIAFTATAGTWAFSSQDPSSGTPATFSFSAASGTVPDGGTTVLLLGAALSGLGLLRRKLVA
jgi:hypothetical protein